MQLEALLAAVLDVEPGVVTADSSAGELEAWDSLAHLSVVAAVEETYGVTCSMAEMGEMRSVASIRSFLGSRAVVA